MAIAGACRDSEKLKFRYHSRFDGSASEREVEPHPAGEHHRSAMVPRGLGCEIVTTSGPLRVDRLFLEHSTGSRFTPRKPPDGDFALYVSRSVGYAPYEHRATVILRVSMERAAEQIPSSVGMLEAIDEHFSPTSHGRGFAGWIIVLPGDDGLRFRSAGAS